MRALRTAEGRAARAAGRARRRGPGAQAPRVAALALACGASIAAAQITAPPSLNMPAIGAAAFTPGVEASAAEPAGARGRGLRIAADVTLTTIVTDNAGLQSGARRSDVILQVSPGIVVVQRSALLEASLAYRLDGLLHARASGLNAVYHSLTARAALRTADDRAGVVVQASAGRQLVSAFGVQDQSGGAFSGAYGGNQAQVFSYSAAPYLSGLLPGGGNWRTALSLGESRTDQDNAIGDVRSLTWDARLAGPDRVFSWALDGSHAVSEGRTTARYTNSRAFATLRVQPNSDWRARVMLGAESDDLRTGRRETSTTYGLGVDWSAGPRTRASADWERRFYGTSHSLMLSHRMARTVWMLSDSQSLQINGIGGRATLSNYDLYFRMFASTEPDPRLRDVLVRNHLQAQGLDPNAVPVLGGFLTSLPTVQRQQMASVAYGGLRTSLVFSVQRSVTRRVGDAPASATDDLARNASVAQSGFTVSLSHRLDPDSTVVLTAGHQRSAGDRDARNLLDSIVATWSERLGPRSSGSLGLRHTRFDSDINPYRESAVLGSFRMQF